MTKRAALYVRQSKSDDEGIERQIQRTTALAVARGWSIAGTFTDDDVSASKPRGAKTAWGQMLAASNNLDVVIAVDLDRIARSTRDLNTLIDHGLALVTVDGEIDLASADGEFRGTMLAAIARFETRRKGERQRRASDQRAAKGLPTTRPGYGYRRVDGRDLVEPAEAAVIRDAARRVLDADSLRSIAADLAARGVPSPTGAPWQGVTLRQLLRRPSLAGMRTHRGVVVGEFDPSAHPPILDRDTHDRLVALFDDPTRAASSRVGHPPKYLLAGIALCGLCGGRMKRLPPWTPKPGQKSKPVKAAYACGDCHRVRRLQDPVDELVTEILLRRLERPDAAELFTAGDPDAVRATREAISAVDARLATAADMFADEAIDAAQLARITAKGRSERERLEAALNDALPPVLPQAAVGAQARASWASYGVERRRAILNALMRVTIMPAGAGAAFSPDLIRVEWLSENT
ncbi:recombinase family protein [Microbacterium sp.]|uniref:recombinase family protein n=1 Tax=Microbacterium sp. TaxID=51671 RepID=UPI003F6F421D